MDWLTLTLNRWRRFWNLPGPERGTFLWAQALLPLTAIALRLVGFARWRAALARLAPVEQRAFTGLEEHSIERALDTARMVQAASRYGSLRGTCLEQSLVLWWLLRRQGIDSSLRIGVRKQASELEAHAWVELGSVVLNDSGELHRHYVPFDRAISAVQDELG